MIPDDMQLVRFFDYPEPEPERDWLDHITSGDWDPKSTRAGYLVGGAIATALIVAAFLLAAIWSVTS